MCTQYELLEDGELRETQTFGPLMSSVLLMNCHEDQLHSDFTFLMCFYAALDTVVI